MSLIPPRDPFAVRGPVKQKLAVSVHALGHVPVCVIPKEYPVLVKHGLIPLSPYYAQATLLVMVSESAISTLGHLINDDEPAGVLEINTNGLSVGNTMPSVWGQGAALCWDKDKLV